MELIANSEGDLSRCEMFDMVLLLKCLLCLIHVLRMVLNGRAQNSDLPHWKLRYRLEEGRIRKVPKVAAKAPKIGSYSCAFEVTRR